MVYSFIVIHLINLGEQIPAYILRRVFITRSFALSIEAGMAFVTEKLVTLRVIFYVVITVPAPSPSGARQVRVQPVRKLQIGFAAAPLTFTAELVPLFLDHLLKTFRFYWHRYHTLITAAMTTATIAETIPSALKIPE